MPGRAALVLELLDLELLDLELLDLELLDTAGPSHGTPVAGPG
ncbi:MAG: hypothetical protein ACRDRK_00645 [Pseudonocardia sp.]